jgi:hypothetical protein
VLFYLFARGPTTIVLLGHSASLYPPGNFVTATYAVLYARFALWWLKRRSVWDAALGPAGCALLYWHITPVAVSFLFPGRLYSFLWYVGPDNTLTGFDLLSGIALYWHAFTEGFSATPWSALLTLGLFAVGLAHLRRFPAGGQAAFMLAVVGFLGVVIHPQHQGRFLASWIFAVWIGAGAGGAIVLERVMPRRAWPLVTGAAGLALAALLWRQAPPAAYPVANYPAGGPSDLALIRPLLGDVDGLRSIAYATTFGEGSLLAWAVRERCRCKLVVEKPWIGGVGSRQEARALMSAHIASSHASLFVIIDAPGRPYELPPLGWTYDRMVGIVDAMADQDRYVRVADHGVPEFGAQISIWRLRDGAASRAALSHKSNEAGSIR